jgi:APA family basic amino acid/polyamine antiporter
VEKVATSLFGPRAAALVSVVLCLSMAGSTSSMIWAGPRVYEAMAADGVAPAALAKRSERGVPAAAIIAQGMWISALLFTGTFEQLVVYAGFALAVFSALGVVCVIALRIREPELKRPYRVGFHPWVPLIYIVSSLWIAVYATWERPTETLLSLLTVALGVPVYFIWMRMRESASSPN